MADDHAADQSVEDIVAGALRRLAQASPDRREYLAGLAQQIWAGKPCLVMSVDVIDIVADAIGLGAEGRGQ
jgi:hypothetical protein